MKVQILLVLLFLTVSSCKKNRTEPLSPEDIPVKVIEIKSGDITKDDIGDFIELDSYIVISNEEMLGEILKTRFIEDKLYIQDNTQKIFCYDLKGNLIFKIDQRGQGPGEYVNIADYCIDPFSGKLYIYDDYARKLLIFNMYSGKYESDISVTRIFPDELAIVDGDFYYHSCLPGRISDKGYDGFYLSHSPQRADNIEKLFFPKDSVAGWHFSLGDEHPFTYSNDKLLYNVEFHKRVYHLEKGQVSPLCDIVLPNQLPMQKIEEKMQHWDVVNSNYSYGTNSIFMEEQILHFIFSKDKYLHTCFYDLNSDKILFCGPRVLAKAREKLPFYSLIKGVYKDKFYAFISTVEILNRMEESLDFFPEDLKKIKLEDNPVIAFYKIKSSVG